MDETSLVWGNLMQFIAYISIYIFTNLGRKKAIISIHREKNSLPHFSQDQLHSSTPNSSLCYPYQLHSVPSARKPLEQCAGRRDLCLGCNVFSLLFLPSCCFLLLYHGPSMGPPSGWRGGTCSGRQQGRNVSAVAMS